MFGLYRIKSIQIISMILFLILLIISPTTIFTNKESITQDPSSQMSESHSETMELANSPSVSGSRSEINLIILKNQSRTFDEDRVVNDVTVRDGATLIIKDCEFIINGSLKVVDHGRLFILNSTVRISPGPVGPQEIIINFSNSASVQISDSNFFTLPQPTLTNISYLISDDTSKVTIVRSYLNIKLPGIVDMDIEKTPPTAGTWILTGETIWNIHNCTIEGYLYHNETDALMGRWFIFTLQRNSKLYMKDTAGDMEKDQTQPFIKPVAGYVRLDNVVIRNGVIDNEVVGEIEVYNLTIKNLNLRDQTKSKIIRSTIKNNLDVGSIAIFSPSTEDDPSSEPKSELYMEDTIVGTTDISEGTILAAGNSTSKIVRCTLKKCSLRSKAKITFEDCDVRQFVEAKDQTKITFKETDISQVFLNDDSVLNIHATPGFNPIDKIVTKYNAKSQIYANQIKIRQLEVWAGDNIQPKDYGPGYDPDLNVSEIGLTMVNSELEKLVSSDDAKISFTLDSSTVSDFSFDRVKNESVRISILDLSSTYNLPDPWPEIDLEVEIFHRIKIDAQVNDALVSANLLILDEANLKVYSGKTLDDKKTEIELFYEKHTRTGTKSAGEYTMEMSYLGFSATDRTKAKLGDSYKFNWQDKNPPLISDVNIDTSYQRTKRGAFVQATIVDMDAKVVSNATIYYRVKKDGSWSDWKRVPMIEIENNTFEGAISDSTPGAKFQFYIEAYDILGNMITTEEYSYELDNTEFNTNVSIAILIIVLIILVILYFARRRAKVKKYLNKPKPGI